MAQVYRTKFYKLKAFRDRFRFASGGLGPYTKIGRTSYHSGTAGQVSNVAGNDVSTAVTLEPVKFHWPR